MEEVKKQIKVDTSVSKSINKWRNALTIVGWLFLIVGCIICIVGIGDAVNNEEMIKLIVGASLVATALCCLLSATLLKGFNTLVKNAEVKQALIEGEYDIVVRD
ncbi:MAG: hypothetical protein IJK91_07050 [Bacteroidales bacterium]|nr:hypothetical protein [Bacteroidales bacterium]